MFALVTGAALVLFAHAAPTASAVESSGSAAASSETSAAKATAAKEQVAACARAQGVLDAGEMATAKGEFEALEEAKCAAAGLAVIRSCELGDAYRAQGKRSDAATAYKKALAENPDAPCAIEGAEKPVARLPARIATWITDALPTVLTFLVTLLVLLLAVLLSGYFKPISRRLAHFWIVRKILSPRLTIEAIDDSAITPKPGAAITARIKERLQRFREEALRDQQPDYQLDHGTGDEQFADLVSGSDTLETALKNARELSDQTKVLAALASLVYAVLPIERLTVKGAICVQDDKTAAGTFALERGARLRAAVTVTAPHDAKDTTGADFVALTDGAAAWVQYVVAQTLASKPFTPDQADSYALVQAGLRYQLEGKLDLARDAYKGAIALNPENWAARVNLAVTEARLGAGPAAAIPILHEALTTMKATA